MGDASKAAASKAWWWAAGALAAALLWAYWPTGETLQARWEEDPQYSHGYLVPAFAAWLLYHRWRPGLAPGRPHLWGLALLGAGLGMLAAGEMFFYEWIAGAAAVPLLLGALALLGGRRWLAWGWPAAAYLLFMVPLPFRAERALMGPLQGAATDAGTFALQAMGLAAHAQGNTILMEGIRLDVLEACSGLRMLITLLALMCAVALLRDNRPASDRLLMVALAVPIALVVNVGRVATTGALHQWAGHDAGEFFHEHLAVFVMMPAALGLLFGAMWTYERLWRGEAPESDQGPEDGMHATPTGDASKGSERS